MSYAESLRMLKTAYSESILSKTQVKAFKDGRETVEDMPRSGRPSTCTTDANIKKVNEIVLENRHASVREIARKLNIGCAAACLILTDNLGIRRVNARLA
nr:protein GVQW3-like [Bactrocera oleae]